MVSWCPCIFVHHWLYYGCLWLCIASPIFRGSNITCNCHGKFLNPIKASDQHVISPYRNTAESFIKITRTLCGMEYIFYMYTSHVSLTGIVDVHFSCELEKKNP